VVGTRATVGAGAVVPNRMNIPPGALAVGIPAVIKPDRSSLDMIRVASGEYVKNGRRFRTDLRRID